MTEETDGPQAGAEGVDAPEVVETPSEATAEQTTATETAEQPDAGEETEEPAKRVPWFQKRIDEVTADKYAERRRADIAEARLQQLEQAKASTPAQPEVTALPTLEQCDWDEGKLATAMAEHFKREADKAIDEKLTKREREQTELQKNNAAIDKLKAGGAKHPDFIAAVSGIQATEAVRDFLLDDDKAPTVLYELGKDAAAAERFNNLSPVQQAIELGKRAATPKATTRTIAPPPPETVSGLVSGIGKTPDEMSMAEYIQWQRERDKT